MYEKFFEESRETFFQESFSGALSFSSLPQLSPLPRAPIPSNIFNG
jgi:hypothetical protein